MVLCVLGFIFSETSQQSDGSFNVRSEVHFEANFSNNCLFIPTNTNETKAVAIKNTELPIMMTSCASYRKRIFASILFSIDILLQSSIGKCPVETEINPRPKLFQLRIVVSASTIHLPNKKLEANSTDLLGLSTSSGILRTSIILFIIFEAKSARVWVHDDVQHSFISHESYTNFPIAILFCPFRTRRVIFEINLCNIW